MTICLELRATIIQYKYKEEEVCHCGECSSHPAAIHHFRCLMEDGRAGERFQEGERLPLLEAALFSVTSPELSRRCAGVEGDIESEAADDEELLFRL